MEEKTIKDNSDIIEVEGDRKKKDLFAKVISGIALAVVIIILILVKFYNKDFPLRYIIIIGSILTFVALLIFFSFNISDLIKKYSEDKKKLSNEKIATREVIKMQIENFILYEKFNHIKRWISCFPITINNNLLFCQKLELLYEDNYLGKEIWIIVDTNNLLKPFTCLNGGLKEINVRTFANGMANDPLSQPDIEETTSIDPLSNKKVTHRKITHKKLKDKEKEKGDLR